MTSPDFGLQMCPTRLDGHTVLFAHKVTPAQCQDRQRGSYHKCWTCVHNNAIAARNGPAAPLQTGKLPPIAGREAAKHEVRVG